MIIGEAVTAETAMVADSVGVAITSSGKEGSNGMHNHRVLDTLAPVLEWWMFEVMREKELEAKNNESGNGSENDRWLWVTIEMEGAGFGTDSEEMWKVNWQRLIHLK